ncbi:phosphotransferase [Streptomyces sp. NPDC057654]|uniref:phosphotransferase n=1 Tax=Streptomyces sp. NPDC057654 TaxID=3346196 RepID=UPI0036B7F82F
MDEEPMPGGAVRRVVRVGDTVRRTASASTPFTAELLTLLASRGWPGAPRWLGVDDEGREVLGRLDGHVAWEPEPRQPAAVSADESLARVAGLVRELHDLTAGTDLAGGRDVVCHNDLAPRNTVYRPVGGALRPVAFIDWDLAAPGERIHDVAHVCWQYLGLGPRTADVADAARRMRLIADGYGLPGRARGDLVETVLWWQDRSRRGIEAGAAAGDPAMVRLRDTGATEHIRADQEWVAEQRAELERALLRGSAG